MPPQFTEFGVSGLSQTSGTIEEEILQNLRGTKWRAALKNMLANDDSVNSLNFLFENLIRKTSWKVVAATDDNAAKETADFISDAMFKDMCGSWQDILAKVISFLAWGWSVNEICYKRRKGYNRNKMTSSRFDDGKVGWASWASRPQDTLDKWLFDEKDRATAMIQRAASGGTLYTIPLEKSLHFRTTTQKDNPEGRSIYRGAYRSWYFKSRFENIEAIGIERDLAGLPVMYVDPDILSPDASQAQKSLKEDLKNLIKDIKRDENEGAIVPSLYDENNNKMYELVLLSTGGRRQLDISAIIERQKRSILQTALADFLMLGSTGTGSFALSKDKTTLFYDALEAFLDIIAAEVNRKAIPDLLRLNGINLELAPQLVHAKVLETPLKELLESAGLLQNLGATFDEEEINYLKGRADIGRTIQDDEQ